MTNQFTSIATGGFSDNTVKTAWDLALERVAHARRFIRTFVDKRPERPAMKNSTINLSLFDWLSTATVTAAKTPLTEESDVDSVKLPATVFVPLTYAEYGTTITRTEKINLMTFVDSLDAYAAEATATHMADTLDELIQDVLETGTNDLFSGAHSSIGTMVATDILAAADVRKAVTKLKAGLALPWEGNFYAAAIHPHTVYDLRAETGSGSWRVPNEYGVDQSRIWNGELGAFEGVRFAESTTVRRGSDGASGAKVYRTWFLGRQAVAEGMLVEPEIRIAPVTDKLSRFRGVGWYCVGGWALYRSEALVTVHSGSSVNAL